MIVQKGDKVHIIYRALFENSARRHFLGEVAKGALCRLATDNDQFLLDINEFGAKS